MNRYVSSFLLALVFMGCQTPMTEEDRAALARDLNDVLDIADAYTAGNESAEVYVDVSRDLLTAWVNSNGEFDVADALATLTKHEHLVEAALTDRGMDPRDAALVVTLTRIVMRRAATSLTQVQPPPQVEGVP